VRIVIIMELLRVPTTTHDGDDDGSYAVVTARAAKAIVGVVVRAAISWMVAPAIALSAACCCSSLDPVLLSELA
jgi:hypothetical protein